MVDSPDVLGGSGRGAGVGRLNRRPLIVVGAILCLILLAVSYTYQLRLAEQRRRSTAQIPPEPVETPAILKDAPDGFIAPRRAERPEAPPAPTLVEKPVPAPVPQPDPYAEEWERWRREREQRRHAREQAALQAMRAATPLKTPAVASAHSPGGVPAARKRQKSPVSSPRSMRPKRCASASLPAAPGRARYHPSGGKAPLSE
jgi:hypothetical protein